MVLAGRLEYWLRLIHEYFPNRIASVSHAR